MLFTWLTTIKQVDAGRLVVERMELDETGFPQPTGELDELDADSLVLALGQDTDLSLLDGVPGLVVEDGVVSVGPDLMTGCPGVFAGGDMVPGRALGHRRGRPRQAGGAPHRRLALGRGARARRTARRWRPSTRSTPGTTPTRPAPTGRVLDRARRESTFDEVVLGHDESTALLEARRCLSCGNCFGCDNCYGVCPDNAVIKLGRPGEAYLIDLDYCKGCGICVAECPSGAIQMVPEEI